MNILLITSSPRISSYSSLVARALAANLAGAHPGSHVTSRDLTQDPLPHIDDSFAVARNTPSESLSVNQRIALRTSNELVQELFACDILIIAAAMINFGIPSSLKAYIDHIVRPRVTFRYTESGPEGLVKGKKAYLVVARGGFYGLGAAQSLNFQDPYLKAALGFIGITDVEVIPIEGVARGPAIAEKSVEAALAQAAAAAAQRPPMA